MAATRHSSVARRRISATEAAGGGKGYTIGLLRRGLETLDHMALQDSWSLSELCQALGEGSSRVFRMLNTFEECGYVMRDAESGRYKLGPRLAMLGEASAKYEQLRWQALPPLQLLADETGETVHVGILFDDQVVTVQLVEGRHQVRMHCTVGKRNPAYSNSLGKVLLAYFPEPEIDAYLKAVVMRPLTPNTITEPAALKQQLQRIRADGYAIDNEEVEVGLRCVAAPVTDRMGQVVASVSVSAPTTRLSSDQALQLVPKVKDCARTISRMLGSPSLAIHRP